MVRTFSTQWSILSRSFLVGTSFFNVVSYLSRLPLHIPSQQSINKKLPPPMLERHVGEEKAWQSIESQPTDSSPTRLVAWGNEVLSMEIKSVFFLLGVWCYPGNLLTKEIILLPRFHQEKIRPTKKKHRVTRKNTVSHGIFTCVILLYYSLYQLLCPVCPSTVCQGSPCFVHSAERT